MIPAIIVLAGLVGLPLLAVAIVTMIVNNKE